MNERTWSEISKDSSLPHEVVLFARNSGKCCSKRKFLEIQSGSFRRLKS